MARPSGPKTRCSGQWTEARFNSFIKSGLRQLTRKWGPMQQCLKDARVSRGEYLCAECEEVVGKSRIDDDTRKRVNNVHIDHIAAVVDPVHGFTTWDECISRMFVEADGFQLLCGKCHKEKTLEENLIRKESTADRKVKTRQCWSDMRQRCNNPKSQRWYTHGERGISICTHWDTLENFVEDMGLKPVGMTLDRIDNDGNYCKANCRWATPKEQGNNRSTCIYVSHDGDTLTVQQWADSIGISHSAMSKRLRNWDVEHAVTLSKGSTNPKIRGEIEDESV